jgi:hypothetical protein
MRSVKDAYLRVWYFASKLAVLGARISQAKHIL